MRRMKTIRTYLASTPCGGEFTCMPAGGDAARSWPPVGPATRRQPTLNALGHMRWSAQSPQAGRRA